MVYDDQGRVVRTERLENVWIEIVDPTTGQPAYPLSSAASSLQSSVTSFGTVVSSTRTVYNEKGQVTRSIAADGQITDYEYDVCGRQTATVGQAVPAESLGLTQYAGNLVRHRAETEYDADGRVQLERINVVQVENTAGNLIEVDRTDARETTYQYDALGNRVKTVFADGSFVTSRYDAFGRQTAEMQQTAGVNLVEWSDNEQSFVVTGWDADGDGSPDADGDGSPEPPPPETGGLPLNAIIPTKLYEYDQQGRLSAVELPAVPDPDNNNEPTRPRYEYGYDALGTAQACEEEVRRLHDAVMSLTYREEEDIGKDEMIVFLKNASHLTGAGHVFGARSFSRPKGAQT
jgi:YD repeat-containing protein